MAELANVLAQHWLASIGCDHTLGTDSPVCSCSHVTLGTFASVGEAVQAWALHVERALVLPSDAASDALVAFSVAAQATWSHIEQEARHVPGQGYTRQDQPCVDVAAHHALLVAEGEAWAAYRQAGGAWTDSTG